MQQTHFGSLVRELRPYMLCDVGHASQKTIKKKRHKDTLSGSLHNLSLMMTIVLPNISSVSSVDQSCLTLCYPIDSSMPGFPVHHQLPELAQTRVHSIGDTIQPSHPLSSPSPPTYNLSQHQGLFKRVSSLHQVVKVLELQLQHQSFQWTFRTDFL